MANPRLAKYGPAAVARGYNTYDEAQNVRNSENKADFWKKIILPVAGFATAGLATAPLMGGAGAAGSVGSGVATGLPASAPIVGAGGAGVSHSMLSRIPWMQVGSKAADTLFGIYANRQQGNANDKALAYQERANAEAMAFEREMEAERRRQFDTQQADARRAWEADQKFQADKWAASEEDRMYGRRRQEGRDQMRDSLISSGLRSPGLHSLGSYRRG